MLSASQKQLLAKALRITVQDVQSISPANIEPHLGEIFDLSVAHVKQLPPVVVTTVLNERAGRVQAEDDRAYAEMRSQQSRVIAQRREDERNDMELKWQSERVASGLRGFLGFAPMNGGSATSSSTAQEGARSGYAPLVTPVEGIAADVG